MKTEKEFKEYVRSCVDKHPYITPSMVVLRSFYIMDIEKPLSVTVKLFVWLRSIAEQEISIYKSLTP